jgi:hypothetical protein
MNLSEDGVLVMQLEQRRLLIRVQNIDDLERYTNFSFKLNKLKYSHAIFSVFSRRNIAWLYPQKTYIY